MSTGAASTIGAASIPASLSGGEQDVAENPAKCYRSHERCRASRMLAAPVNALQSMNEKISAYLSERIAANDFPSAVYLVAEKGEIVFHEALGNAVVEPERIPARLDTIYDLASLTKVLITGLLCARLLDSEAIDLDHAMEEYFPEELQIHTHDTLIFELLTHTSGYEAWKPFYLLAKNAADILNEILNTSPVSHEPEVIYSDLNFLALMFLLERVSGQTLEGLTASEIIEPLGLENTGFNPNPEFRSRIAASEFGNEYERKTCIEKGHLQPPDTDNAAFRDYQIWSEVHDGNAWFMGGVGGHAGLFSTAEEVFKIALQFLPEHSQLLKAETCELFRTNFTEGMNEDRSLAFQLASTEDSTAGTKMSPESFGHNGFTGTSLWVDPEKDRIFILLTNRTHYHPLPFTNINAIRRQFHDLAIEELDSMSA